MTIEQTPGGGYHWAYFAPGIRIAVFIDKGTDTSQLDNAPDARISQLVRLLGKEALGHIDKDA